MKLPKHLELWLPSYLSGRARRLLHAPKPKRLWVAFTDHYEPLVDHASLSTGLARVAAWQQRWPEIALAAPRDASGNSPRYTFFYPQDEYRPEILAAIEPLCRAGFADVEVHIHHYNDTAASLAEKLRSFCARLHEQHGLLRRRDGQLVFGFIHGNWALDNSLPDGQWCGVTGELKLLRDLGCYADFTMPAAPSAAQSRIVNQIYWTTGAPTKPRGFDHGVPAAPGRGRQGEMLMVPGPLGMRFRGRLMPRIETSELAAYDLPTPYRVQRWLDLAPQLGDDIFLKLFGHSAREDNGGPLLGYDSHPGALAPMFRWIAEAAAQRNLELHWATAYEMFSAIDRIVQPAPAPATAPTAA